MHFHLSKWQHSPPQKLGCHPCLLLPAHLPYLINHQDLSVESPKQISRLSSSLTLHGHQKLPVLTFSGLGPWNSPHWVSLSSLLPSTMQSFITSLSTWKTFHGSLFIASWVTCKFLNPLSRVTMCLSLSGRVAAMPAILVYLLIMPPFTGPRVPVWLISPCLQSHFWPALLPDAALASHLAQYLPGVVLFSQLLSFTIGCNSVRTGACVFHYP